MTNTTMNNTQNTQENQARYSDMNMKRCVTKEGGGYIGVTVKGPALNPSEPKKVGDRLVINFTMPINSRAKYIETMTGSAPYEKNGTVWARVSFWQDANVQNGVVDRLDYLFKNNQGKPIVLIVAGSISLSENAKDGQVYVNTDINGSDYCVVTPAPAGASKRSFLDMKRCSRKNGNRYIGVSAEVTAFQLESRTVSDGSYVVEFNSYIHGRSKYIENMCGMAPYTNESGSTRVKVVFWKNPGEERSIATRLENLFKNNPNKNFVLVVTGVIDVKQNKDSQGRIYIDTTINCDSFSVVRSFDKKGQEAAGNDQGDQPTQIGQESEQMQEPAPQQSIPSGFDGDFVDIDDDDDELPF